MKRLLLVIAAALAACAVIGCAEARADVNANVSIDADAGETAGLSSSPTVILQDLNDNGSRGVASVGYGWPVSFPGLPELNCPATGCADRSAGATAAVDEAAGVLRSGAAASVLVGNAPDPNYGGLAFVRSQSSVDDTITLASAATVIVQGTVHGTLGATNGDPIELSDPSVETDVKVGFCCQRNGEAFGLIGGYNEQFFPDNADGSTKTIDETFSIPVQLPAGDTEFQAALSQDVHMLVDGVSGTVLSADGRADFTGTVTFQVVVPDDVVATSASGLLPIVGGAQPAPSDTAPPVSTASVTPVPNSGGWSNSPVTVHIAAADGDGGSGVASIVVAASGAETMPATTTDGDTTDVSVSAEGTTTLTYYATDAAGNAEAPQSLTVKIDRTAPTVSYDGNLGVYSVDQDVVISCHASDSLSGIAASACSDESAPAYSLTLGVNTLKASATDNAGNTGSAETSFTVVDDPAGIGRLTLQFVTSSARYASLSTQQQAAVRRIAGAATRAFAFLPSLGTAQRAVFLRVYSDALAHLVRVGWLSSGQATTLNGLAAGL